MAISNKAPVAIAYPEIDYDKLLIVKHIIEGWIDEDGQVQGSMTLTLQAYRTLPDGRNELDPRGPKQEVVPDVFNPTLPTSLIPVFNTLRDKYFGLIWEYNNARALA
jgi:hypothetical protein